MIKLINEKDKERIEKVIKGTKELLQREKRKLLVLYTVNGDILWIGVDGKIEVATDRNPVQHEISLESEKDIQELLSLLGQQLFHWRFECRSILSGEYY